MGPSPGGDREDFRRGLPAGRGRDFPRIPIVEELAGRAIVEEEGGGEFFAQVQG